MADLVAMLEVTLPARPRLPAWACIVDLGDGRVQMRSARANFTLRAPELTETLSVVEDLLDGRYTVEEIREKGGERAPYVKLLLKMLRVHGFLEEAAVPDGLAEDAERYRAQMNVLGQLGSDPLSLLQQLRAARVTLIGRPELTEPVAESLAECAVTGTRGVIGPCDLVIGSFDGSELAEARTVNADCVAAGVRFLPVFMDGPTATLGPTVVPYQTACLECLEYRRASAQASPDEWVRYRRGVESRRGRDTGRLDPLARLAAWHTALEAVRLLTAVAPAATIGTLLQFGVDSPMTATQTVLKVPRCEVCSRRVPAPDAWDVRLAPLEATE